MREAPSGAANAAGNAPDDDVNDDECGVNDDGVLFVCTVNMVAERDDAGRSDDAHCGDVTSVVATVSDSIGMPILCICMPFDSDNICDH